jgi:hypothetical protein
MVFRRYVTLRGRFDLLKLDAFMMETERDRSSERREGSTDELNRRCLRRKASKVLWKPILPSGQVYTLE